MSSRFLIPLAVAAILAAPGAAQAQEGTWEPGNWVFRVGMSQFNPKETNLELAGTGDVVVDSDISPTANVEYMLNKYIGTELMASWPFTNGIDLKTGGGGVTRVGHADIMPPTLSLNWHFNPDGIFRPYIGAGVNYTVFSGEETRGPLGGSSLKLDDSFGAAGQVGVDIGKDNWFVNLNARYIDMKSDAELDGADVGELDLDPWMYGLHVGYRFGSVVAPAAPEPEPVA